MSIAKMESEFLPLDDMRRRVRDLFAPKPAIYWADFLFHVTLAWSAFYAMVAASGRPVIQAVAYVVCVLAMYRSVIFTHELAHLRRDSFAAFRWAWNLLCGFPMLLPSFVYSGVHNHHHRRNVYGTGQDGEYYPFAAHPPRMIVTFLVLGILLPGLLVVRFVLLVPFGWASGRIRRLLWVHASSLTLDPNFRRAPSARDEDNWPIQDLLTFVYGTTALVLLITGVVPWAVAVAWYLMVFGGLSVNSVRTLAAHRYRNASGRPMTVSEQFLDSVDVPGHRFFTALWAPVGLRYHATHHLFPSMPYHNLGQAHRRMLSQLPGIYAQAGQRSLWEALGRLWSEARASRRCAPAQ